VLPPLVFVSIKWKVPAGIPVGSVVTTCVLLHEFKARITPFSHTIGSALAPWNPVPVTVSWLFE
jgi:hypothetical protein